MCVLDLRDMDDTRPVSLLVSPNEQSTGNICRSFKQTRQTPPLWLSVLSTTYASQPRTRLTPSNSRDPVESKSTMLLSKDRGTTNGNDRDGMRERGGQFTRADQSKHRTKGPVIGSVLWSCLCRVFELEQRHIVRRSKYRTRPTTSNKSVCCERLSSN